MIATEQIRLAFEQAQKEVDDLRRRTVEGLRTAKENGKQVGQVKGAKYNVKKSKPRKEFMTKRLKMFGGDLTDNECITLLGISRNTFYKYKRELTDGLD